MRLDQYDEGKDRQWLALGLQGLAPYGFELDVTAYVGDNGLTGLAAEAECHPPAQAMSSSVSTQGKFAKVARPFAKILLFLIL